MKIHWAVRSVAFLIGVVAAVLASYGAWEMQMKIEKVINYLVIAAPFVTFTSALMPPMAESLWNVKHRTKSVVTWLTIVPVAVLAFFSAYERVHYSKEAIAAEQRAFASQKSRLEKDLEIAQLATKDEVTKQDAQLKLKACKEDCQAKWKKKVDDAREVEANVQEKITEIEKKLLDKPEVSAPLWLLPATLDLLIYVSIWITFAPNHVPVENKKEEKTSKKIKRRRKRKVKSKKVVAPKIKEAVEKTANDNVVHFPVA